MMLGHNSGSRGSKSVSRTIKRTGRTPTIPSRSSEAGISKSVQYVYVPQKLAVCIFNADDLIRTERVFDPNFNYFMSTAGIASCVGLIIHDQKTKSTVLAHIDSDSNATCENITKNLLHILIDTVGAERDDIRVTIHNNGINDAKFHALLSKDQAGTLSEDALRSHTEYRLIRGIHHACSALGVTTSIHESTKDVNINVLTGTVSEYNERAPTDAEIVARISADERKAIEEIAKESGAGSVRAVGEGAKAGGLAAVLAAGDAGVSRSYAARQGVLVGARAAALEHERDDSAEADTPHAAEVARRAVAELSFANAPVASPGISQEGSISKAMETWPNHDNCFVFTLTEPMQLFHHHQIRSAQVYETPDHHEYLYPLDDERVVYGLSRFSSGRPVLSKEPVDITQQTPIPGRSSTSTSPSLSTPFFGSVRRSLFRELQNLESSGQTDVEIKRTLIDELNESESSENQSTSSIREVDDSKIDPIQDENDESTEFKRK